MRHQMAGPGGPSYLPGRLDSTPFKALPGETLAPLGRSVVPVSGEPLSDAQAASIWMELVRERDDGRPKAPCFSRDIWLYLVCRFVDLQTVAALQQTCKAMQRLLSEDALWRDLYIARFGPLSPDEAKREAFSSWKGLLKHRLVTGRTCFWSPAQRGQIDFNPFGSNLAQRCIIRCKCCSPYGRHIRFHGRWH